MTTNERSPFEDRDLRISGILPMDAVHGAMAIVGGVGALGNEVLKNLALLGFGRILICDIDRVEIHNLTRSPLFRLSDLGRYKADAAAEHAREINPDVITIPFSRSIGDLGLGAFRKADIVFSTFDGDVPRIITNAACMQAGTPWVDAGLGIDNHETGEIALFNASDPDARCYTCGMDPSLVVQRLNGVRDFAVRCVNGRASNKRVGASLHDAPRVAGLDAAIYLEPAGGIQVIDHLPCAANAFQ